MPLFTGRHDPSTKSVKEPRELDLWLSLAEAQNYFSATFTLIRKPAKTGF